MSILIKKVEGNIKFYLPNEREPSVVIYKGKSVGIVRDDMIETDTKAALLGELMHLVSAFITSINTTGNDVKKKVFDIAYIQSETGEIKETTYSPKNLLDRLYSNEIVTVDRKKRIRLEFVSFGYDGRILIAYKPVIW